MPAFSTTTELMPHQITAVAKALPSRVAALFMYMRTGKTRTAIELAYIRQSKYDWVVYFCPVSLKHTVRYQILLHTNCTPDDIYVFDDKTDDANLPSGKAWYIIGTESMSSSNRVVLAANKLITDQSFVIVDESTDIKGHRANRTQRITNISARCRYRLILTGTPFTQGAVDLYSQMKFLSPKILGYASFWSFSRNHLEFREVTDSSGRSRRTGHIIATHNDEYLAARIAPYVYQVEKEECFDLPDKLFNERILHMTDAQEECYEQAKEKIIMEADPDDWSGIVIFRLFTALQTITCGWWNRVEPDGSNQVIDLPHLRIEHLMNEVASIHAGERVIIWAKFQRSVQEIIAALDTEFGTGSATPYYGLINHNKRNDNLERWRNKKARFLVGTQSTGGRGLDLNEANHTIFYANSFKYEERAHALERCHGPGKTISPEYTDMICEDSIDTRIQRAIAHKGNALDVFQRELNQFRDHGLKDKACALVRTL